MELGLMAHWLAGRRNVGKFGILKFILDQTFKLFAVFNKVTALFEQYECVFLAKACFKVVVESVKMGKP